MSSSRKVSFRKSLWIIRTSHFFWTLIIISTIIGDFAATTLDLCLQRSGSSDVPSRVTSLPRTPWCDPRATTIHCWRRWPSMKRRAWLPMEPASEGTPSQKWPPAWSSRATPTSPPSWTTVPRAPWQPRKAHCPETRRGPALGQCSAPANSAQLSNRKDSSTQLVSHTGLLS